MFRHVNVLVFVSFLLGKSLSFNKLSSYGSAFALFAVPLPANFIIAASFLSTLILSERLLSLSRLLAVFDDFLCSVTYCLLLFHVLALSFR